MDFFDIIKSSVLQVLSELRLTETCIGEVIEDSTFKIRLGDKMIIEEDKIIWTNRFDMDMEKGTRLLLLRENGGQRYFIMDIIERLIDE